MAVAPALYKVFIKVPQNRGGFVDPPDPNWSPSKDKELWRTLSSASKGRDIDWHGLADKFDTSLDFLLKQAAWLYDRQLSQVREQLRRVNKPSLSSNPSPSPPLDSTATSNAGPHAQAMKRGLSAGQSGIGRPISNLTLKTKDSGDAGRQDSSSASPALEKPQRGPYSRTPSTNTITQLQKSSMSPVAASSFAPRSPLKGHESVIRRPQQLSRQGGHHQSPSPKASSSSTEASDSDDEVPPLAQSRAFQRRPRLSSIMAKGKTRASSGRGLASVVDDDDDDDDDNSDDSDDGFLPFATGPTVQAPADSKGSAASRASAGITAPAWSRKGAIDVNRAARPPLDKVFARPLAPARPSSRSASPSSASAASHSSQGVSVSALQPSLPAGDHHPALAALSPRQRRSVAKDGSDTGSPSMGSSFSDLDDASVSRSAMEEALAQQMRAGSTTGAAAASALRGSLAMGMGGLWKTRGGGGHARGYGRQQDN